MGIIHVEQPGMLTTIQDLGRWGFGQFGMPVAGVMDAYAARVGNILLQNADNTPVLEVTMLGPVLCFEDAVDFAITGGNLGPCLNDQPLQLWTVYHAKPGDRLHFTGVITGCRAYLAVVGGFEIPLVMGSASTYLRGKLGGYDGRSIKAGDILKTKACSHQGELAEFVLPADYLPEYRTSIRVILGPQDDMFTPEGLHTFFTSEYIVTNEADRMGYRLDGPKITHKTSADIISDGIAWGAIQVPAHGAPIIMLADRQTTGGYPKIATVISVDIPSVAQKKPGESLRFEPISIQEAQRLYRESAEQLNILLQLRAHASERTAHYTITVNGQLFQVSIQDIS